MDLDFMLWVCCSCWKDISFASRITSSRGSVTGLRCSSSWHLCLSIIGCLLSQHNVRCWCWCGGFRNSASTCYSETEIYINLVSLGMIWLCWVVSMLWLANWIAVIFMALTRCACVIGFGPLRMTVSLHGVSWEYYIGDIAHKMTLYQYVGGWVDQWP